MLNVYRLTAHTQIHFGLHVWLTRSVGRWAGGGRRKAVGCVERRWGRGVAGPKRWFDGRRFICLLSLARKFSLQLVRQQGSRRRRRRRVSRGEGEKKLIFKKFHFRMKRNQSAKLARSQRLEASLINLQLRDEAAVIAASQSGLNFNYRAATQLVQRIWPALCDLITSPHTIMPDRKTNNQCANFLTHFLATWGNQQQGRNPRKKPSNANDRKNINSASHLWR